MTGHTWTVSIARSDVRSVHYCDEAEANRIAAQALAAGLLVTDGPREMGKEERECGMHRREDRSPRP